MLKKIREQLKKKDGFSLIELLVVIAIMGVIALVAIPNVVSALDNSKKNTDKVNASAIATAITTAKASGETIGDCTNKEFSESEFSDVIPKYLQSAPTVKYDGGSGSVDHVFYVTINNGRVVINAKTGSADTDYAQIYPKPASPWDN